MTLLFTLSYGLSIAILNMIQCLLFTAKLLILTIQGKGLWDITMKTVGFLIQTLNIHKQYNLLFSIKAYFVYSVNVGIIAF